MRDIFCNTAEFIRHTQNRAYHIIAIVHYPFSQGDQKSHQRMQRNSREFFVSIKLRVIGSQLYCIVLFFHGQVHLVYTVIVFVMLVIISEETARLLTDLADIETKKGTAITACTALSKEKGQVRLLLDCRRSFGRTFLLHFDENQGRLLCCFQFRVVAKSKDTIRVVVNIKCTNKILKTPAAVFYCSLELVLPWCRETVYFKIADNFFVSFYGFSYYLAVNQKPS